MGEEIKLLVFIIICFSFSLFGADSGHDAIPVATVESLETKLSELKSKNPVTLSYPEVTKVWKEISLLEPSLINEGELQIWEKKRSDLLLDAGRLRYRVIDGNEQSISFNDFLYDSYFELTIIPTKWLRLFEYKYLTIKSKLESGSSGLRTLLPEFFSAFLFLFLPFIAIRINSWLLSSINALRDSLTNPQNLTASRQNMAIFLQRSGPFIPLALTILALKILSNSFSKTILSEISILIPFILYYLYYRIFRQLIINFLIVFSEYVRIGKRRETQLKIFSSTKIVGRFFLSVVILLHLVSSVAGKGLLFQEIYFLSIVVSVFVYFWVVKEWTEEIDGYAKKVFIPQVFSFYEKLVTYPVLSFLIRTLSFAIIIFHPLYDYLKNKIVNINWVKILIAKLFQKKLEANENLSIPEETSLPEDYLLWFKGDKDDDESLWIDSKNQKVSEIQLEVDEWLKEVSEEHSMAIYGDKGIGKSQVLRHLESFLKKHEVAPEVIMASVPPKMNTKKDVLNFLGNLVVGKELNDVFELLDFDKSLNKKVIILDDAHNLFLTHFGGLKGIETFFEALSVRTDNIFWVASFNTYSWIYLDQVFHKNRFFRTVFKIKGFSDEELQDYILRRHNKTGYSLSYADIIRAVKTNSNGSELSYVENMFFRILWEQSRGNPELAEKVWLASLKPLYGKRFRVGLPLMGNFVVLNQLADESFFVFAALARHENLTTNEFIKVTDMKEGVVRHCLRIGLENGFVYRSDVDRRYRFTVDGQYPVLNILKAKNFIYE